MISLLAAGAALTLTACEAREARTVTVEATGRAEAEPDRFEITVSIMAEGTSREEAAQAMQDIVAAMGRQLPQLAGLTHFDLESDAFSLDLECLDEDARRFGRQLTCEEQTFVASQSLIIRGAPAREAGNLASLAYELGAYTAGIGRYYLSDSSGLRDAAARDAVQHARQGAHLIVQAMGGRLGEAIPSLRGLFHVL